MYISLHYHLVFVTLLKVDAHQSVLIISWTDREICDNCVSYSNGICFLSNDDFDYTVTAKHAAEEAIGWKPLPENITHCLEKMNPNQIKWGR